MFCFLKGKTEKNEKHVKYDSGKEQKKKICIVDPVEKCCQFTRVAFFPHSGTYLLRESDSVQKYVR